LPQKQYRTLATTKTWTGALSNGNEIELPTDFLIQQVIIDFSGDLDITVGVSVLVEDALQAVISRLKLDAVGRGGSKTIVDLSGADIYVKNLFDYGVKGRRTAPTAIANDSVVGVSLILDFRLDKHDPEDWNVAIPSWLINTLKLTLDFALRTVGYGTNTSNESVTATVTVVEGIPMDGENFNSQPLLTMVSTEYTLANSTGLEKDRNDISVGGVIRRVYFISKTNAGARSDIQIDDLTIKVGNITIRDEMQWEALLHECIQETGAPNYDGSWIATGWVCIEFAHGTVDEKGFILGFDATELKKGDIKVTYDKLVAQPKIRVIQETVEG
jgi:hypothetical protein